MVTVQFDARPQGRVVARQEEPTRADSCDATVAQVLEGVERLIVGSGREVPRL